MENESYKEENKSETGQFGNDQVDSDPVLKSSSS